jgi:hypothetical protein
MLKMLRISLKQAERLVENRSDLYWDGWTIVATRPSSIAMYRPDGVRIGTKWFTAKRFDVQSDGLYHIPKAYRNGLQT